MSSPRLFSPKPDQTPEEKIAPTQMPTELSIRIAELDSGLATLALNYTTMIEALRGQRSDFSYQGIVRVMSLSQTISDVIKHLYMAHNLKNKDKTLDANISSVKTICKKHAQTPGGLEVYVTRFKELQALESLLITIYLTCKADINHQKIKYINEHSPSNCSPRCIIQ